jgi:translation initiation factor 3 subunit I
VRLTFRILLLIYTDLFSDTVAVDPTGKGYASGGEDGYVRVHQFDKAYFDFTYEVERQARAQGQM